MHFVSLRTFFMYCHVRSRFGLTAALAILPLTTRWQARVLILGGIDCTCTHSHTHMHTHNEYNIINLIFRVNQNKKYPDQVPSASRKG